MKLALMALVLLSASCGYLVELELMGTFDPELAGATADFTDGVTTVPANFLDALELRFSHVRDAAVTLAADGDTAIVAEPNRSAGIGDNLAEVSIGGTLIGGDWDINAKNIFNQKNGAALTIETRDLKTMAVVAPAREFVVSWAAGNVINVVANSRYLCAMGNDSGAGTRKIDIWDLTTDALVGTFVVTGTPSGFPHDRIVLGRDRVFIQTNTGANGTVYAVLLATAAIDAAWATGGAYTRSFGPAGNMAADDQRLYLMFEDDIEGVFLTTGATAFVNVVGMGSGTLGNGLATDGRGGLYVDQFSHLSRWRVSGALPGILELVDEMATPSVSGATGVLLCDGRWLYRVFATALAVHYTDHLEKWADFVHQFSTEVIRHDGIRLYGHISIANGAAVDGFKQMKTPFASRRFQRLDSGSHGALPFTASLAPTD